MVFSSSLVGSMFFADSSELRQSWFLCTHATSVDFCHPQILFHLHSWEQIHKTSKPTNQQMQDRSRKSQTNSYHWIAYFSAQINMGVSENGAHQKHAIYWQKWRSSIKFEARLLANPSQHETSRGLSGLEVRSMAATPLWQYVFVAWKPDRVTAAGWCSAGNYAIQIYGWFPH